MKIRNGFVSNSSSSSFVVIGVKVNSKDYIKEDSDDYLDDIFENGVSALYIEEDDYDYVAGIVLADGDDYLENTSTTLEEFKEMSETVAKELKVDASKVSLITGTRAC